MALERFHFEHDGTKYDMPLMNQLKMGQKIELGEALDISTQRPHVLLSVIAKIAGDAGEAIKDMYDDEFNEVFKNWSEASQAVPGK